MVSSKRKIDENSLLSQPRKKIKEEAPLKRKNSQAQQAILIDLTDNNNSPIKQNRANLKPINTNINKINNTNCKSNTNANDTHYTNKPPSQKVSFLFFKTDQQL